MNLLRKVQNFSMRGVGVFVLGMKELCGAGFEGLAGEIFEDEDLRIERGMSQWPRSSFWRGRVLDLV